MTAELMPRKRLSISVDSEVLSAIEEKATALNTSISRMIETVLIGYSKEHELIPSDYIPLGETRGGDRTSTNSDSEENS